MKYTAEKVRDYADACRLAHKGPVIADMLTELAERIKVDESAAPVGFVMEAAATRHKFGLLTQDLPPGAELFTHPPAQVAQVDESRYTAIGRAFCEVLADPSVAWRDTESKTFIDRVCQTTSRIESAPTAEPVTQGESGVIRHVGDSRFESWFSEYVVGQNGAKQQARDAYGAGLAEQAERLAAQPAQSVDVAEAIRKGFMTAESCGPDNRYVLSIKFGSLDDLQAAHNALVGLTAALQEKGNG